jgi:hypothetical protein
MKKLLFVLAVILVIAVGCVTTLEVKDDPPTSEISVIAEGCLRETYLYAPQTRTYYFRHKENINYPELIGDLMAIEGVQAVVPAFYQAEITISKSYTWDEVEPHILKILKSIPDSYPIKEEEETDKANRI